MVILNGAQRSEESLCLSPAGLAPKLVLSLSKGLLRGFYSPKSPKRWSGSGNLTTMATEKVDSAQARQLMLAQVLYENHKKILIFFLAIADGKSYYNYWPGEIGQLKSETLRFQTFRPKRLVCMLRKCLIRLRWFSFRHFPQLLLCEVALRYVARAYNQRLLWKKTVFTLYIGG